MSPDSNLSLYPLRIDYWSIQQRIALAIIHKIQSPISHTKASPSRIITTRASEKN